MSYRTEEEDGHIYYNISKRNQQGAREKAVVSDVAGGFINNQSDYEVAILFFSLKLQMPLMVFPIQEGSNPFKNLGIYGVAFEYGGNTYSRSVMFEPDNVFTTEEINQVKSPFQNNGLQDLQNPINYYFIYDINHLLAMINKAFLLAYNDFNTANPGIHNSPPFYVANTDIKAFEFIAEYSYRQDNPARAKVFINNSLLNITNNPRVKGYRIDDVEYKDFECVLTHDFTNESAYALKGSTIPTLPPTNPEYLYSKAHHKSFDLLCNIKSLILTSNGLACRSEYLPRIAQQNELTKSNTETFSGNALSVLSYHDLMLNGEIDYRNHIYYNPYYLKYIDLVSNSPIFKFDIEVLLETTNGRIIPAQLPENGDISIKLDFRRKNK